MKKQLALATAALMALSLAACGSTAPASSAAESTSTAASSEAASTDSTAADDGDVLQQAAAAAFANDVTLTMWGAEEDQELLRTIADNFNQRIRQLRRQDHHQPGHSVRVHSQGYRPDRPHRRC